MGFPLGVLLTWQYAMSQFLPTFWRLNNAWVIGGDGRPGFCFPEPFPARSLRGDWDDLEGCWELFWKFLSLLQLTFLSVCACAYETRQVCVFESEQWGCQGVLWERNKQITRHKVPHLVSESSAVPPGNGEMKSVFYIIMTLQVRQAQHRINPCNRLH